MGDGGVVTLSNSQCGGSRFRSSCVFTFGQILSFYVRSGSLTCMSEYLAIGSGGCMCMNSLNTQYMQCG